MPTLAKRVVGALLALLGLVLTVIGLWYAVHLGGSGTATFSSPASGTTPVLVPQTVLNRVDGAVTRHGHPPQGWHGLAGRDHAVRRQGRPRLDRPHHGHRRRHPPVAAR